MRHDESEIGLTIILLICGLVGVFMLYSSIRYPTPEKWYVERRFGVDWEFNTMEEARQSAGSGRIYKR